MKIDEKKAGELLNKGANLFSNGDIREAIKVFEEALIYKPSSVAAHFNLGLCYQKEGKGEKAIFHFEQSLLYEPHDFEALNNLGNLYLNKGGLEKAKEVYQKAIIINPRFSEGFYNLGVTYQQLGENDKAILNYKKSLHLNPRNEKVLNNLAVAYKKIGKTQEAIKTFNKALNVNPDMPMTLSNLGALLHFRNTREAYTYLKHAVEIDPTNVGAIYNLATVEQTLDLIPESITSYKKVIELDPKFEQAYGQLYNKYRAIADWESLRKFTPKFVKLADLAIKEKRLPCETPFLSVSTYQDPKRNYLVAQAWSEFDQENIADYPKIVLKKRKKKKGKLIKIGYLSNDFREHATMHLLLGVLRLHNRKKFQIYAYAYGSKSNESWYRKEAKKNVYKFIDIGNMSDVEAAKKIVKDKVDILVDLKGHTSGCRLGILALRPAPVIITWLGFPGTTGASCVNYLIADKIVVPKNEFKYYSEKVLYLPDIYQPNDNMQEISSRQFTRADFKLPTKGFVFSCFNQTFKIEPRVFSVWMKILKKVPGSVLWLWETNKLARKNLSKEARKRGINPKRLVFSSPLPKNEHLKRLTLSDLSLDTFTYNGHTSTSDSLWAGVPVVTLKGKHFASRVSASLLTAIDLSELITKSEKEYKKLAISLAKNSEKIQKIRQKLLENRVTKSLFDTQRFVLMLEKIYEEIWQKYEKK
jgi:protein O-GlcNAc transferase